MIKFWILILLSYTLVSANDFNNDGYADILFKKDTNETVITLIDDSGKVGQMYVMGDHNYTVEGIGDFDGNDYPDILYKKKNKGFWLRTFGPNGMETDKFVMQEGNKTIEAVADINGDGNSDIVIKNNIDQVVAYLMNGPEQIGRLFIKGNIRPWDVVGMADINGDGNSDIIFKNSKGSLVVWLMDGTHGHNGSVFFMGDRAWSVVGTGDFDGDGSDDIVFKQDNGAINIWTMNGAGKKGQIFVMGDRGYQVGTIADFNADGYDDILFKQNNGQHRIFYFDYTGKIGTVYIGKKGWTALPAKNTSPDDGDDGGGSNNLAPVWTQNEYQAENEYGGIIGNDIDDPQQILVLGGKASDPDGDTLTYAFVEIVSIPVEYDRPYWNNANFYIQDGKVYVSNLYSADLHYSGDIIIKISVSDGKEVAYANVRIEFQNI